MVRGARGQRGRGGGEGATYAGPVARSCFFDGLVRTRRGRGEGSSLLGLEGGGVRSARSRSGEVVEMVCALGWEALRAMGG